jgi:hypothetical protein
MSAEGAVHPAERIRPINGIGVPFMNQKDREGTPVETDHHWRNYFIISHIQHTSNAWHTSCNNRCQAMNELKTGFLMLAVCIALCVQANPHFWGGLCQFVGHLFGVVH